MTNSENKQGGGTSQKKRSHKFFRRKTNNKPNNNNGNNGSSSSTSTKNVAKKEYKFHMHDAQARKTSESFEKIKKAIILKIQETFEDSINIVDSLEKKTKKVLEKPKLKDYKSTETDPDLKKLDEEQLKEEWKQDYNWYKKKENRLEENWSKAYALIWKSYCSKEVQVALEEMSDFESRIKGDPLELLKEIETLMHVPQRAKYPPLTLVEVLYEFMRVKQGEKESLIDYLNRFKSEVEVVKRLFGKSLTNGYTENKDAYKNLASTDTDQMAKMKAESWEEFIAVLFLRNSNHARFSGMLLEFRKSYANNDDKYPKNLMSMVDVMRQQPEPKKP